ncbi:hypothetical protein DFP76_10752 [Marinomonas aquiplantarum]|uniref:L-Lysine epsilon oxidase N-terminal domain-containing protein n=1 Tax=Marinomonas aquiplantarum TaxID=491951 RepID=A0A366CXF7_9GAMM|nr:hypothetical protein DFP76_10752 [Marinomonas aquiplantarum]
MALSVHPSIGIARLGNANTDNFVLNPIKIGGLPYEHDADLKPTTTVVNFKDEAGCIRRQGQVFKVFDTSDEELTLDSPNVKNIEWTVHLANKKAAWCEFRELNGNLLYGQYNSYTNRGVPWRNASKESSSERQSLIIDLGPRVVSGILSTVEISIYNIPATYLHPSYPSGELKQGSKHFKSLGTLRTDRQGRLIVLGGYGFAGGNTDLSGYGGGDDWYDDISDGSVTCFVTYSDDSSETTTAWMVVGSPDFAPEIVNISTLSDTCFDVGVRNFDLVPDMYDSATGNYESDYVANFDRVV